MIEILDQCNEMVIDSPASDKDDLEWLADDIVDHGSALAAAVRKLSQCQ